MGRHKKAEETRVEMLKAQITYTETGYPVELEKAREIYGQTVTNAPEEGWFWIGATPRSAADIRDRGHRAVGSETTTWIPPVAD